MTRILHVLWDSAEVGRLRLDAHGDMIFQYSAGWLADGSNQAISASLPLQERSFSRRQSRPFFAGLLPDEAQREAAARALGVSRGNDFALLDALGGDVAGALVLWPDGSSAPVASRPFTPEILEDRAIAALLEELPRRPFLAGEAKLRVSLAGAQPKLPVVLVDGQVALPSPGQPTTHILKPPVAWLKGSTENEAFCLRLAAAAGLAAASAEPRRAGDKPYLLIERYDRLTEGGNVRRIHQEDFCQALGIAPERKYAAEGGPNLKTCFDLVRNVCAKPAADLLRLLDAVIFNAIIGNADAHGKNFSLLYGEGGATLAPSYDLMATFHYPQVATGFAMKIAKMSAIEDLDAGVWSNFAAGVGLAAPFVRRRVVELADLVVERCQAVSTSLASDGFGTETTAKLLEAVPARARTLMTLMH
jgi:serine/threonine-protein kinase HipA